MDREKMDGHMIEQNKPPLRKAYKETRPSVSKPVSMAMTPRMPKVINVFAGFSCP